MTNIPIPENEFYLLKFISNNERALSIIENEELFFNLPHSFNDPLEFRVQQKPNAVTPTSTRGVCCFTKSIIPEGVIDEGALDVEIDGSIKNQLLWSHYADSHKGLCLVFSQKTLIESWKNFIDSIPVEYHSNADLLPEGENINHKSKCWMYENEFRFILKSNRYFVDAVKVTDSGFLVKFPIDALKGIYFGCNSLDASRQPIYRILSDKIKRLTLIKIDLFTMQTAGDCYGIRVKRMEPLISELG